MKSIGILFIISGFSGAGKGTILKEVFAQMPDLKFSVSATSREPRVDEENGIHYYFISEQMFEKYIENDAFIEYTRTFNNYYGTLKSEIENPLREGRDVLFDINVTGAKSMKEKYPDAITVFVTPPTLSDLRIRLMGRKSETMESLDRRIAEAKTEIADMKNYDYIIVNDDINKCAKALISIIKSAKYQTKRNFDVIKSLSEEQK
ncbi:MAG TPA: guanylate kinase [Clostridia bacterium]|nr:guanylate kinase [Clostridia bacterium]